MRSMIEILTNEFSKGPYKAVLHCFSSGEKLALTGIELWLRHLVSPASSPSSARRNCAPLPARSRASVFSWRRMRPISLLSRCVARPNEPAHTAHTLRILAETLDMPPAELEAMTTPGISITCSPRRRRPTAGQAPDHGAGRDHSRMRLIGRRAASRHRLGRPVIRPSRVTGAGAARSSSAAAIPPAKPLSCSTPRRIFVSNCSTPKSAISMRWSSPTNMPITPMASTTCARS